VSPPSSRTCARCGSPNVHRSRARSRSEKLVRAVTPLTVARCHQCGHRAWTLRGSRGSAGKDAADLGTPGRPLETRDAEWFRRRRRRLVLGVAGAALLGAALAIWFAW
jgi:hypothetical protein